MCACLEGEGDGFAVHFDKAIDSNARSEPSILQADPQGIFGVIVELGAGEVGVGIFRERRVSEKGDKQRFVILQCSQHRQ